MRETIQHLITGISEFVTGLWNAEKPFEYLKNAGMKTFSSLVEGIKMVVTWLSTKFGGAVKRVSGLFDGIFDTSETGVWPTMLKILKEVVEFIGGKAVEVFQNFGTVLKKS